MEARSKLIDIAAFLDRLDRAESDGDFREAAFLNALSVLKDAGSEKARAVLEAFSDPSTEPIARAHGKGACGAWNSEDAG